MCVSGFFGVVFGGFVLVIGFGGVGLKIEIRGLLWVMFKEF